MLAQHAICRGVVPSSTRHSAITFEYIAWRRPLFVCPLHSINPAGHARGLCQNHRDKQPRTSVTTRFKGRVQEENATSSEDPIVPSRVADRDIKRTAVVVGAGPAGSVAAIHLARRGYDVQVYESRPEPEPDQYVTHRSYAIAVSHRGLNALAAAGIDMSQFKEKRYKGSMQHFQGGGEFLSFHKPIDAKVLMERGRLVRHILNEAQRLFPTAITFHWNHTLQDLDVAQQEAVFAAKDGSTQTMQYDLLIGADGVNSRVREAMAEHVPSFKREKFGYMHRIDRFFHGVKTPDTIIATEDGQRITILHFFHISSPPPLMTGLFFVNDNLDGTCSGGLSFTRSAETGDGSGAELATAHDFHQVIQPLTEFPEEFLRAVAEQLAQHTWFTSGTTLVVNRLTGPRIALVGDAAHAVSAAFGQGVNAALEDCSFLARAFEAGDEDPDQVLKRYNSARFPDANALADMDRQAEAFQGIHGMRNLSYLMYTAHMRLGGFLHRLAPRLFPNPNMLYMLMDPRLSYGAIYRRIKAHFVLAVVLAAACAAAVAIGLVRLFSGVL